MLSGSERLSPMSLSWSLAIPSNGCDAPPRGFLPEAPIATPALEVRLCDAGRGQSHASSFDRLASDARPQSFCATASFLSGPPLLRFVRFVLCLRVSSDGLRRHIVYIHVRSCSLLRLCAIHDPCLFVVRARSFDAFCRVSIFETPLLILSCIGYRLRRASRC